MALNPVYIRLNPVPTPRASQGLVPLAYIRTLTILPPIVKLPDAAPLPTPPSQKDKRALAKWVAFKTQRDRLRLIRSELGGQFASALSNQLGKLPGLSVSTKGPNLPAGQHTADALTALEAFLADSGSDAALQPVIDGFVVRSGLQKELWIHAYTILGKSSPSSVVGTYSSTGMSAASSPLFGMKGAKSDNELAAEALDQAARRLAHTLDSGEEQLFGRKWRIAIVPATVNQAIRYQADNTSVPVVRDSEPVSRLADVLLQPEVGPFVTLIDPDEVDAALQTLKLQPAQFWTEKSPDLEKVGEICKLLRVGYIFLSRVSEISVTDDLISVMDAGTERAGVERKAEAAAEAALVRISDMRVVWKDSSTGTTTSRTEYVRHNPRIVRIGQCAADAARVAYARLRYSLEEFQKRFDRRH